MRAHRFVKGFILTGAVILVLTIYAMPAQAGTGSQEEQSTPTSNTNPKNPHDDPLNCLGCHDNPKMVGQFPDGGTISLFFDPETHPESNHMPRCAACHDNQQTYPHEGSRQTSCTTCHWQKSGVLEEPQQLIFPLPYPDERTMSLDISGSCKKCHKEKFTESADSVHLQIMDEGNRFAPVCVDCHSSHDIVPGGLNRASVPVICSECHLSVYTSYESSVHGAALKNDSNPDVPTCGDCHGIHNVHGPRDANFKSDSIQTCGNCHSDPQRMDKYGLSTAVVQTYLDDFHGRTVDFFRQSESGATTAAACSDCHGIHNIRSVDDPVSTIYPENQQHTCQQCHGDASIRFPQAWLSHYVPTWEETPLLFVVNQMYRIMIPVLIGGFIVYILLDARRRLAHGWRRNSNGAK